MKETPECEANSNSKFKNKKNKKKLKTSNSNSPTALRAGGNPRWLEGGKVSAYAYEMCGHVTQTADRYVELAGKTKESLKKVATPCIDDNQIPPEEFDVTGELSPIAA